MDQILNHQPNLYDTKNCPNYHTPVLFQNDLEQSLKVKKMHHNSNHCCYTERLLDRSQLNKLSLNVYFFFAFVNASSFNTVNSI